MYVSHHNHHKFFLQNMPENLSSNLSETVRKRKVWRDRKICIRYDETPSKLGSSTNCKSYSSDKGYFTVEDIIQYISDYSDTARVCGFNIDWCNHGQCIKITVENLINPGSDAKSSLTYADILKRGLN